MPPAAPHRYAGSPRRSMRRCNWRWIRPTVFTSPTRLGVRAARLRVGSRLTTRTASCSERSPTGSIILRRLPSIVPASSTPQIRITDPTVRLRSTLQAGLRYCARSSMVSHSLAHCSLPRPSVQRSTAREVALTKFVEDDGEQDDGAEQHLLQIRIDVEQVHRVVEHADQQRAEEGPDNAAAPARQAGAPDDDCSDRLEQLIAGSGLRRARREERHIEESNDRRTGAADHVDRRLHARDVDTREPRRLFVAADRKDVAPETRPVKEHGGGNDDDQHPDHRHRYAREMQRSRHTTQERADTGVLKVAALQRDRASV